MTLSELIIHLTELAESTDSDPEVRIAYQPSWPLRATLSNVTIAEDCDEREFLWLAAGYSAPHNENPYAPGEAWEN